MHLLCVDPSERSDNRASAPAGCQCTAQNAAVVIAVGIFQHEAAGVEKQLPAEEKQLPAGEWLGCVPVSPSQEENLSASRKNICKSGKISAKVAAFPGGGKSPVCSSKFR